MKEYIEQLYKIKIDNLTNKKETYILLSNKRVLILKKIVDKTNFINNLKYLNNKYHKILFNYQNGIISNIEGREYVLLEPLITDKVVDIKIVEATEYNDISKIWERKIDGYKRMIDMNSIKDKRVIVYMYYAIGILENSIRIYNKCYKNKNVRNVVSHNRLSYPNIGINYYDPTNVVIDSIGRDFIEIIKESDIDFNEKVRKVLDFIYKYRLNTEEINLMLVRLLYPNKLVDYFDDEKEYDLKSIKMIMEQIYNNQFLYKELVKSIKKTNFIDEISWIL